MARHALAAEHVSSNKADALAKELSGCGKAAALHISDLSHDLRYPERVMQIISAGERARGVRRGSRLDNICPCAQPAQEGFNDVFDSAIGQQWRHFGRAGGTAQFSGDRVLYILNRLKWSVRQNSYMVI
jgi:hypothetical protein